MTSPPPAILSNWQSKAQRGFTMIELMITVTIVVVLASIAVPSMGVYVRNNRLSSSSHEFLRTLQTARSEAVKRQPTQAPTAGAVQISVVVCASADLSTCTTTGTPTGWIMFEDDNSDWVRQTSEPLIEVHSFDSSKMALLINGSKSISYSPSGFANLGDSTVPATQTPATNAVMCDNRGNVDSNGTTTGTQSVARGILIANTGRAYITSTLSKITSYLASIGLNCPS